jgi:hypothetical protein
MLLQLWKWKAVTDMDSLTPLVGTSPSAPEGSEHNSAGIAMVGAPDNWDVMGYNGSDYPVCGPVPSEPDHA